ncbi:MAG: hypothetical protein AABX83_00695 [Nanoarchaeota archaeon]
MKRLLFISFIFLLLASVFVYAAGSAEIPRNSSMKTNSTNTSEMKRMDCENLNIRVDRIRCRLQNKTREENVDYNVRVPEACRTLKSPTSCIALYKNVQRDKCYDHVGAEKDRCFRRLVGFSKNNTSELSARNYLILLLYGLEERIEDANEAGTISDSDTAEIIDLIVDIKQSILDGEKRAEIVVKLNELKQMIKSVQ